jgi:rhomboid family GlyGly-CTERM serine protease
VAAAARLSAVRPPRPHHRLHRPYLPDLPKWTAAICAAALAVCAVEPLGRLLVWDREAIASGELWRLVTGHLVHHSPAHLAIDVAAFAAAGSLVELRRLPRFAALCLAAAAAAGGLLWVTRPGMGTYGGLSGLAVAAVVYLCLDGLGEPGPWRRLCAAALAAVTLKLGYELVSGSSIFGSTVAGPAAAGGFVLVPESHLAGAAVAAAFAVVAALAPDRPADAVAGGGAGRRPGGDLIRSDGAPNPG